MSLGVGTLSSWLHQPGLGAPNQLPVHQLGPVRSVVLRAERGLGKHSPVSAQHLELLLEPAPSPSPQAALQDQSCRICPVISAHSSRQGGWGDRGTPVGLAVRKNTPVF